MLDQDIIFIKQRERLQSISSLGLSMDDADTILKLLYEGSHPNYLTPKLATKMVIKGSKTFSFAAADIFSLNIVPASIRFPTITGHEEQILSLLMGYPGYDDFRRDKGNSQAKALEDADTFLSVHGSLSEDVFKKDPNILIISDLSKATVAKRLGGEFAGNTTTVWGNLNSSAKTVYIDAKFLLKEWEHAKTLDVFDIDVLSVLNYYKDNDDAEKLSMIIHSDDRCVSRIRSYN